MTMMKLQELIGQTDLDMTPSQVKAFLLGALTAERPLPFPKAMEEMLSESPKAQKVLEQELKIFWDELQKNKVSELKNIFSDESKLEEFLTQAKDQLDFYLTALSLSGTNIENCKNEEWADLIDELEDFVMELDDYLSENNPDQEQGEELKENLLETWDQYVKIFKP